MAEEETNNYQQQQQQQHQHQYERRRRSYEDLVQENLHRKRKRDETRQTLMSLYQEMEEIDQAVRGTVIEIGDTREEIIRTKKAIEDQQTRYEYLQVEVNHNRKTFERKCAEYLSQYKWYWPQQDNIEVDIATAWSYFEHVTLPRYLCDEEARLIRGMSKATPGTLRETRLYPALCTPQEELGDFGIGIGLYFTTVRALAVIIFIAGIMNIPLMVYYGSETYNPVRHPGDRLLSASAVCLNTYWVPCIDCTELEWEESGDRWAKLVLDENDSSLNYPNYFVFKNACPPPGIDVALSSFASVLFILLAMVALDRYLNIAEVRYDENEQTATDYSIRVNNPPADATDVDEWRRWFMKLTGYRVTFITVALNNKELIDALICRRLYMRQLRENITAAYHREDDLKKYELHPVNNVDLIIALAKEHVVQEERQRERDKRRGVKTKITQHRGIVSRIKRLIGLEYETKELLEMIENLEQKIQRFYAKKYEVCTVFVTFEQEEGQRKALTRLNYGKNVAMTKRKRSEAIPKFRGRILHINEPPEPDAVNFIILGVPFNIKICTRLIAFFLTMASIVISFWCVSFFRSISTFLAALSVSAINAGVPTVCKLIHKIEYHTELGISENYLYLKITLFRWTVTAVLITIITPFLKTLSEGDSSLLPAVMTIFVAEIITSPLIRVLDLWGMFKKHFLAPRATTQDEMNLFFKGTPYFLAERYTEMTKILFLTFFYAAYLPSGFFLCSVALLVYFYSDKYCLLRVWAPAPMIGTQLAVFSRTYFFTTALTALGVLSAHALASFPCDNLCTLSDEELELAGYNVNSIPHDTYRAMQGGTTLIEIPVNSTNAAIHKFCDQNLRGNFLSIVFPAESSDYAQRADDEQKQLAFIYAVISVIMILAVAMFVFGTTVYATVSKLFLGTYESVGVSQQIDFSCVSSISAYVPQARHNRFSYPLLVCDISKIQNKYIGFGHSDQTGSVEVHNLIHDVPIEDEYEHEHEDGNKSSSSSTSYAEIPRHELLWNQFKDAVLKMAIKVYVSFKKEDRMERLGGPIPRAVPNGDGGEEAKEDEMAIFDDSHARHPPKLIFSVVKHYPPRWIFEQDQELEQ